ncbi:crystallin beta-gamma domain containing 2 [Phyllostomus discolor]|uniref:Crystallin beta-gamma domain containing 2 n=1 Tax=Phyllostomus discolor TaxID=89673 RepID=A0A834ABM8_9CHIR|nr:crystallin beta-gamma domain containing 2 [Phyllostomus discolor]
MEEAGRSPARTEARVGPQALPSVKNEGITGPPAATIMPMGISEAATVPGQPPSSPRRECIPSPGMGKVPPSPAGPQAPESMGTGASPESRLVPDSTEDKTLLQSLREEEEEVALDADLETFLDTLRSMESPEILRTHRLPRAPRSSYLATYATLPPIEEDQPRPGALGPSPQEVPALEEKEKEEEEEEEPENPYLSDDEKLQRRQEKAWGLWDSGPTRPHQTSSSPLEMMKKHVTDAKRSHSEPGSEWQMGTRPTSRLGGSLFFGGLVPATKEVLTFGSLGTKLSALPPHEAPGLRKVPGQLPLLCSEKLPTEKPECAGPAEGWLSTEDAGQTEHQARKGDPLLRARLPRQQQGGLGRHC